MRPFVICIHDATPAHAAITQMMIRHLSVVAGNALTIGVVPCWQGAWSLEAHPEYCALLRESGAELLMHGFHHHRRRGGGAVSLLAERSDEMNGLAVDETIQIIGRGQCTFEEVFGRPARGFLAPAWQRGHVRLNGTHAVAWKTLGIDYTLGFFAAQSGSRTVPLATYTWDCGRWGWLGNVGDALGALAHAATTRIPVLAIHPRDHQRGYWPRIVRLTDKLLMAGYEPKTPAMLLGVAC